MFCTSCSSFQCPRSSNDSSSGCPPVTSISSSNSMWLWRQLIPIISSWLNAWDHNLIVTCELQSIKQFLRGVVVSWAVTACSALECFLLAGSVRWVGRRAGGCEPLLFLPGWCSSSKGERNAPNPCEGAPSGSWASLVGFGGPNTVCAFVAFPASRYLVCRTGSLVLALEHIELVKTKKSIKIILLFLFSRKQWFFRNVKTSTKIWLPTSGLF